MPDTVEVIKGNMPVAYFRDLKGRTESLDEGVRVSAANGVRRKNKSSRPDHVCIGRMPDTVEVIRANMPLVHVWIIF